MRTKKLFQVLVVGGALMGTSCIEEGPTPDGGGARDASPADASPADASVPDPGDASVSADSGAPESDAGELESCGICPNDACCVVDDTGASHTREGFVCCWGTSC